MAVISFFLFIIVIYWCGYSLGKDVGFKKGFNQRWRSELDDLSSAININKNGDTNIPTEE